MQIMFTRWKRKHGWSAQDPLNLVRGEGGEGLVSKRKQQTKFLGGTRFCMALLQQHSTFGKRSAGFLHDMKRIEETAQLEWSKVLCLLSSTMWDASKHILVKLSWCCRCHPG